MASKVSADPRTEHVDLESQMRSLLKQTSQFEHRLVTLLPQPIDFARAALPLIQTNVEALKRDQQNLREAMLSTTLKVGESATPRLRMLADDLFREFSQVDQTAGYLYNVINILDGGCEILDVFSEKLENLEMVLGPYARSEAGSEEQDNYAEFIKEGMQECAQYIEYFINASKVTPLTVRQGDLLSHLIKRLQALHRDFLDIEHSPKVSVPPSLFERVDFIIHSNPEIARLQILIQASIAELRRDSSLGAHRLREVNACIAALSDEHLQRWLSHGSPRKTPDNPLSSLLSYNEALNEAFECRPNLRPSIGEAFVR